MPPLHLCQVWGMRLQPGWNSRLCAAAAIGSPKLSLKGPAVTATAGQQPQPPTLPQGFLAWHAVVQRQFSHQVTAAGSHNCHSWAAPPTPAQATVGRGSMPEDKAAHSMGQGLRWRLEAALC